MANEKLIASVLEAAGLPMMPPAMKKGEKGVWVRAVARVRKCNNNEGFALLCNVYDGMPQVAKVFDDYGVAEILEIYPYEWLPEKLTDKVEMMADDPQKLKEFIVAAYGIPAERLKSASMAKAKALAYNYCIRKQLENERNEE